MSPTLDDGSFVLYEPGAAFAVGDVVVLRHPHQSLDLVKRVAAIDDVGLIDVRSDNEEEGTDSRSFGRVDPDLILGRVTLLLERPFIDPSHYGHR